MKRSIIAALLCGMMLLSSCSGRPDGVAEKTYDYAQETLEVLEDFENEDISIEEATEELDRIYEEVSSLSYEDIIEDANNSNLSIIITTAKLELTLGSLGSDVDFSEEIDNLNALMK